MPIFLIWIYLSWLITLFGAVIAAALPVVKFERWWHMPTPGSEFEDAVAVLKVLVAARHGAEGAAVDVASIRTRTRFGLDEIEGLLEQMLAIGWVARVATDFPKSTGKTFWRKADIGAERWMLVKNPALLKLSDVYSLFVFTANTHSALASKVNSVINDGLAVSLEDYLLAKADNR